MRRNKFIYVFLAIANFSFVNCDIKAIYPCSTPNNENAFCVCVFTCSSFDTCKLKSYSVLSPEANESLLKLCATSDDNNLSTFCDAFDNHYLNFTSEMKDLAISKMKKQNAGNPETTTQITAGDDTTANQTDIPRPHEPMVFDSTDEKVKARREYVRKNLLPSTKYCGLQQTDDRYNFRNVTELDEFPWLADLKISEHEENKTFDDYYFLGRCGGVLISNRYVLTHWECGYDTIKAVLGGYTTNETSTCFDVEQGDCTAPRVEYRVESKVASFMGYSTVYRLLLLRLNKKVRFTDYVRPICLPMEGSQRSPSENYLTFSGWGASDGRPVSKKKLVYNITDVAECSKHFPGLEDYLVQGNISHVCLKPPSKNPYEVCYGDHGGPLMYKHRQNWYAGGILIRSVNQYECTNNLPVSGALIRPDVVDWILDNIHE